MGGGGNITCTIESSPKRHVKRVGVSALRPESVTSSTVSPMERTKVALTKETTMYASCSSPRRFLTVHTALGLPGSSETAISDTASPWLSTRSVERAERPQMETSDAEPATVEGVRRFEKVGEVGDGERRREKVREGAMHCEKV